MRVLLIEDDATMSALVNDVLVNRGHEVAVHGDIQSAWQAVEAESFPLIVADWMLPGGDGLEFCRRLRSAPNGRDPVVMIMTARNTPRDLAMVLEAGANDYIAKPFDVAFLHVRLTIAEQHVEAVAARARAEAAQQVAARVEGALLAATTVEHNLGNQLARTLGYSEMLAEDARLPDDLRELALIAKQGVLDATATLDRLLRITRLEEAQDLRGPPVLDLERSVADPLHD